MFFSVLACFGCLCFGGRLDHSLAAEELGVQDPPDRRSRQSGTSTKQPREPQRIVVKEVHGDVTFQITYTKLDGEWVRESDHTAWLEAIDDVAKIMDICEARCKEVKTYTADYHSMVDIYLGSSKVTTNGTLEVDRRGDTVLRREEELIVITVDAGGQMKETIHRAQKKSVVANTHTLTF